MTGRNLHSDDGKEGDLIPPRPFLLKPAGKDYLWGGNRLNDDFSKGIDMVPLAETWECSTHPDGPSTVASGEFAGMTLAEVLRLHPEYLGTHPEAVGGLPVLIKLIDAKQNLSIQVHPDDKYAAAHENGQRGKAEFWYVLDATREAQLICGFSRDVDRAEVRRAAADGTLERLLQKVPVKKDDLFYIRPGTVHAFGAGVLAAEIQQSSDLTYRLYDYGRVDRQGNQRELHVEKALDVADLKGSAVPRQPMRVLRYRRGCASELLCRCPYFEVSRVLISTEHCREMVCYRADSSSFRVLLCTDGCGSLFFGDGEALAFFRGDCIFVPAASAVIRIHGQVQFLDVRA